LAAFFLPDSVDQNLVDFIQLPGTQVRVEPTQMNFIGLQTLFVLLLVDPTNNRLLPGITRLGADIFDAPGFRL
jgi:hypothetical protein